MKPLSNHFELLGAGGRSDPPVAADSPNTSRASFFMSQSHHFEFYRLQGYPHFPQAKRFGFCQFQPNILNGNKLAYEKLALPGHGCTFWSTATGRRWLCSSRSGEVRKQYERDCVEGCCSQYTWWNEVVGGHLLQAVVVVVGRLFSNAPPPVTNAMQIKNNKTKP